MATPMASLRQSTLQLTSKQLKVVHETVEWAKDPHSPPVYKIGGYAGTGKTTIAKNIAVALGQRTFFCAPTGKAASVLERKGCVGATTLHSLMGIPRNANLSKLRPNPRSPLGRANPRGSIVIVDEASMVGQEMMRHLRLFGVRVLAIGDPAQLQPVKATPFFTEPLDALLDEIHRSKADSPVTYFATQARQLGYIKGTKDQNGIIYRPPGTVPKMKSLMKYDQIIVHDNEFRHIINRRIRDYYDRPPHQPAEGDRIMCLQNNYNFRIMNGEQYHVLRVADYPGYWLLEIRLEGTQTTKIVPACKQTFFNDKILPRDLGCFEWGFATTAHKAQGSEWGKVLVLASNRGSFKEPGWLYTAITRASERIVVVSTAR